MAGGTQNVYARHPAITLDVKQEVTFTTEVSRTGDLRNPRAWSIDRAGFFLHRRCGMKRLKHGKKHHDNNAALAEKSRNVDRRDHSNEPQNQLRW